MLSLPALSDDGVQTIVLIGMPGVGKTTVGAALARLLEWGFVDIDDLLGDPAAIIERDGIESFRAQERDAIVRLPTRSGVVAAGGGAVLDSDNRAALAELGPVVWLRATLPTLLDHVGDGAGRPLLADGVAETLDRLAAERTPLYEALANVTIDVDGLDENEIAVEIVKALS